MAAGATPNTRKVLTLKDKIAVINYVNKNPGCGSRKVASVFNCGKTQIQGILKNRAEITEEFEKNVSENRKRHRVEDNAAINEAVYRWYCLARERNVPVTGPLLQEEALLLAKELDPNTSFKASNGWLDSFKKRHNIKCMKVSGECADVSEETVTSWFERVQVLTSGYEPQNIWNEDETGCFYRALPDKSLSDKKKECRGGKKAKERITIAFFANASGGKEPPIVIGKSATPRCFKGLKDKKMPHGLSYFSNSKAWMNTDIMETILTNLNRRFIRERRNVLLLLDNVASHSPELKDKFSNIKVVFLPVNTTSRLQPLDAGIIKNFKVLYRKSLVKHTLAKINDSSVVVNASSICKSVDILLAIRWVKQAWESVTSETVKNCFRRCGISLDRGATVENEDPFADLDSETEDMSHLDELVQQLHCGVTADEYITVEEDLTTCFTFDGASEGNWRQNLRTAVVSDCGSAAKRPALELDESSDEEDEEDEEVTSIQNYDTALTLAKDLQLFLVSKGEEKAAEDQQKVISALEDAKLAAKVTYAKQTSIMDFMNDVRNT